MNEQVKTTDNKESQELLKKHYLLEAYSTLSEGGESLDNDPDLIEDNRLPSNKDEELEGVDYFIVKGEMKRYKTKTGMYKGSPCTWVMQVTQKGFEAIQDRKYLKAAEDLNSRNIKRQLEELELPRSKRYYLYDIGKTILPPILSFGLGYWAGNSNKMTKSKSAKTATNIAPVKKDTSLKR